MAYKKIAQDILNMIKDESFTKQQEGPKITIDNE